MAIETICDNCEGGVIYNDAGYPDRPAQWQCDQCFGTGRFATFQHDACGSETTVPDSGRIEGCTFDCACGKVMVIEKGQAVDLYERMAANIREQYGVEVSPHQFGYVEL